MLSKLRMPTSLKLRLTTVLTVLVLGATVSVTTLALLLVERDMKAVIGHQQYVRLAGVARTLDDQLGAKQDLLSALAEDLPAAVLADPLRLQAFLAGRSYVRKHFSNIAVFDPAARLVASVHDSADLAIDGGAQRPFLRDTLLQRRALISAPFKSTVSGGPVILLTQPVMDDKGVLAYILSATLDLESANLFSQIASERPGKTGFLFIMTAGGILVNHPTRARLLEHINARPGYNPATERALRGFEGWTEAPNKDGVPGIYAYKRMQSTNWIVAARYPTEEAFAPIRAMRERVLLASALFAALAGALGWLAIRRLVRPIDLLRRQAMLVREGKSDSSVLQLKRTDEIGELSGAIYALVAAREKAQNQVADSESLIRNLLEGAPDAFVSCDSDGLIVEWNARAEETFGWTRAQALGRNIAGLMIPEDMRAAHHLGMRAFARTGTGPIVNTRIRVPALHRDGHTIPVELSVGALQHGDTYLATAFLHDISDRIAYEEAIAAGERRARMIADAMPALIAYVDSEERYRFINARYHEFDGIDAGAMIGSTVRETLGARAYGLLADKIARAQAGEQVHFELEDQRNGRTVHYMGHFVPDIGEDGSVGGFYSMVMDISERKTAELRQAESERRADAANRAKSEFVANISHEIRTPLNGILGVAHLLGSTRMTPEQKHDLDMIRVSGMTLLRILNDVLDFSKMEAGRMDLSVTAFDLLELLDVVATMMTVSVGDKRLDLSIGIGPGVPLGLRGDALRLQQVLTNLVGNAIKFTASGHVALRVEAGTGTRLRFIVSDSGIGISAEEQARMFQPFSQADASTTRRFGGTGLGLAISRRIVDLMDGTLAVHSTPGGGSTFVVEVGLAPSGEGARLAPRRILLLAPPGHCRQNAEDSARACGWQASSAASLADQDLAAFDAILIDWDAAQAPALLAALHANPAADGSAIMLAMNSATRNRYIGSGSTPQAHAILLKPLTPARIADALAPRAGSAGAPAGPGRLAGARLLMVEDNQLNQFVARGILEQAGASVQTVDSGEEALALLTHAAARFDAVLMDVQMPGMDGYSATRLIRRKLQLDIPVLAMSAGVLDSERASCIEAGMDDFIAKPIDVNDMLATIARHLPDRDGADFDLSRLQKLGTGNPAQAAMLRDLVRRAVQTAPADFARAVAAFDQGDPARAAAVLHELRAGLGNFGAAGFLAAAQRAEAALVRNEAAAIPALLERARSTLFNTVAQAQRWLDDG